MKKYSFIYLLIGFAALILFSQKVLLPLVYDVVKSDAFLMDTKDQASQYPISNELTDLAYLHCTNHIKSTLSKDKEFSFSNKPLKAWTLGNYHYLINAEASIKGSDGVANKKFVCRITYEKGEDKDGVQDLENWTIEGIDGIDGL